jgi:cation diffusion facilitator CzcD-associated flavoprotein CzcO
MAERRRVLVIGAGISGLTVAHELTRTSAARARWTSS